MLRADLVPARHLRHHRAGRKRLRNYPPLLRVAPAPPAANATANLDAPARRQGVNYMVDHVCKPISSTGLASSRLRRAPQDEAKTSLTIKRDMAKFDQPCRLAQVQNLQEQRAERLQMPLAEVADGAKIRRIERHSQFRHLPAHRIQSHRGAGQRFPSDYAAKPRAGMTNISPASSQLDFVHPIPL